MKLHILPPCTCSSIVCCVRCASTDGLFSIPLFGCSSVGPIPYSHTHNCSPCHFPIYIYSSTHETYVPTLYIAANSHGCLAIFHHLQLTSKGDEIVNAYGKTRTPEFLAMNPCHGCPTLQLDNANGDAIWESNAIMRYLCVTQEGGEGLYPTDPVLRAKIDMVMDWRQTSLYKCLADIGYPVWGIDIDDTAATKSFAELIETHFVTLLTVFLQDGNTPYCYSESPTIADLAIAPALTFIMARKHMWDKVPKEVKEYRERVLAQFPDTKENFDALADMCAGYTGKGADLEP